MANPRHGKEQPHFNTKLGVALILGLGILLGVLIVWFLRPIDTSTITHTAQQHVRPVTGKIIARAPQVKHKALTAGQLHYYHARHVAHVLHEHVLHVRHVWHESHVRYLVNHWELSA